MKWAAASLALLAAASPVMADCPIERAVYRDLDGVATLEFALTEKSATVTNTFQMRLGATVALDGIIQWTSGVARPNGMLTSRCPEGDVTGEEIAACTVWRGVVYTSDNAGNLDLLPAEGAAAPMQLLFPDLGASVDASAALRANAAFTPPWNVFAFERCRNVSPTP